MRLMQVSKRRRCVGAYRGAGEVAQVLLPRLHALQHSRVRQRRRLRIPRIALRPPLRLPRLTLGVRPDRLLGDAGRHAVAPDSAAHQPLGAVPDLPEAILEHRVALLQLQDADVRPAAHAQAADLLVPAAA